MPKGVSSRPASRPARGLSLDMGRVLLILLFVLGAVLIFQNAFRFFMYDDEGGYAYAAWRISLGEVPYRDFFTPQLPSFLYWGGLLVRLFGRSYAALRIPSMLATLGAAALLYAINNRLFGRAIALGSMALFFIDPNVFHNARFYRPEAYMLLFSLAGLYVFILGEERQRLRYLWLAGLLYGISITFKLFGFLSLGGCFLYLLYAWWRERRPRAKVVRQFLALGLPVLVLAGAMSAVFYHISASFFVAIIEHQTMQGASLSMLQRLWKGVVFFKDYAWFQPVLILLFVVGAISLRRGRLSTKVFLWQLPTALSFLVLSRSLMTRHLTYLAPAMATLVSLALIRIVQGRWQLWRLRQTWHLQLLALVLACLALKPGSGLIREDANRIDPEPYGLAKIIQQLTGPGDVVVADFPGINFAAGRPSTYWAAGISGGAAESGQIRGSMLNEEIEQSNAAMVIVNTRWSAHQMVKMVDYPVFRSYVQSHFALIDKYKCTWEQLEVYARTDTMPLKPDINFQDQILLTGVRPASLEVASGRALPIVTRWQALSQMPKNYTVSLRLVDAAGHLWAQIDELLVEEFSHREPDIYWDITDRYNTSDWTPQQVVLQKHQLPVPATVPSGTYYLTAQVYVLKTLYGLVERPGEGARLPTGDTVIAQVRVTSPSAPDPSSLGIAAPLDARLIQGIRLLGVGPLPQSVGPGRALGLTLFWQADRKPEQDYRLELQLTQGGSVLQRWPAEVAAGFPTGSWQQGNVLLGEYVLPLPEGLVEGSYGLQAQLLDGDGQAVGQPVALTSSLRVKPKPNPATITQGISHRLEGLSFADGISLLGYDLSTGQIEPGETLRLTLYWACSQPPSKDYKVFTHLLDGASQLQGQADAIPGGGHAPTSGWAAGDVLADSYDIPLQTAAPSGPLQVEVGFYEPLTGARLPALKDGQPTGEDRILLPVTLTVP